jgi:hypothetical protein
MGLGRLNEKSTLELFARTRQIHLFIRVNHQRIGSPVRYRQSELVHARWAMLGVAGILVQVSDSSLVAAAAISQIAPCSIEVHSFYPAAAFGCPSDGNVGH